MRKLRKNCQRKLNRTVRTINKNIINDNLWRGRFLMHQIDCHYHEYSDGSGAYLMIFLRVYDKYTDYYKDYILDYSPYYSFNDWHVWNIMNDFITRDAGVWDKDLCPSPFDVKTDFSKTKVKNEVFYRPRNYYVNYKGDKNNV